MHGDTWDEDGGEDENIGLAFGQGFFCRSEVAAQEDTSEIMSFLIPEHGICVSAFLVDDFNESHEWGFEVIPNVQKGISFVRIDQNLWGFIEDVSQCEHEAAFFQGLVLGELLSGTAHRMVATMTGQMPGF